LHINPLPLRIFLLQWPLLIFNFASFDVTLCRFARPKDEMAKRLSSMRRRLFSRQKLEYFIKVILHLIRENEHLQAI